MMYENQHHIHELNSLYIFPFHHPYPCVEREREEKKIQFNIKMTSFMHLDMIIQNS